MKFASLLFAAALAAPALAQEATSIDLTGVQIRNGTSQSRTSTGTISPSCAYDYAIDGMVKGSGLVLGGLFLIPPRWPRCSRPSARAPPPR